VAAKKHKNPTFSDNVREKALQYTITAFGLVAGLAWNDAVAALIQSLFPIAKDTVFAKFIYAIIITAIVVVVSIYLVQPLEKKEVDTGKRS
jgi:hypothetical protein